MKKLEKLTLKELNNSGKVLNSEEANSMKGGGWEMFNGAWTYMLDEVTVYGSYSPQGSIGGLTPEQQYSAACAEGYTAAFEVFCVMGVVLSDFYLWLRGAPVGGQFVIDPSGSGYSISGSY